MELWLPIVLAAVLVFVVSSLVHMVFGYHRSDYGRLDGEDRILDAMRANHAKPGCYRFPWCNTMQEASSPEMRAKYERGPVGLLTLMPPGPMTMGKSLLLWFLFCIVISVFVGYLGTLALARGADAMAVFRFTTTAALLGYGVTNVPNSIWHGIRWSVAGKFVFDGILYAVVTSAAFTLLWPAGTNG
jgi:hypothetical protein